MGGSSNDRTPAGGHRGPVFAKAQSDEIQALQVRERGATAKVAPLRYVPTWDALHNVLSTYTAGHFRVSELGEFVDDLADRRDISGQAILEADVALIRESAAALDALRKAGGAAMIIMPVHYESLATSAGRSALLLACNEVPPKLRRFLSLEFIGVPEDTAQHVLTERVGPFRSLVRMLVLAILDWNRRTMNLASGPEFGAIALMLPSDLVRRRALMSDLPAFASTIKASKKIPAIVQLTSRVQLEASVGAGVIHLTGSAVGGPMAAPGNMLRCSLDELPYNA